MGDGDVKKMSPAQRVLAMEALWEAMCQEADEPSSPSWHEPILAERRQKLASGEGRCISLDELSEKLAR